MLTKLVFLREYFGWWGRGFGRKISRKIAIIIYNPRAIFGILIVKLQIVAKGIPFFNALKAEMFIRLLA